eukprot:15437453-Alexandrium_andersonii.AAC.1
MHASPCVCQVFTSQNGTQFIASCSQTHGVQPQWVSDVLSETGDDDDGDEDEDSASLFSASTPA